MNWYKKSENFAKNAKDALKSGLYDIACFSCHQAIELYLKGKIIDISGSKPYTHSLIELIEILEKFGYKIQKNIKQCIIELNEHYIQARYPDARISEYTKNEAEKAIKCMEEILDYVKIL